MKGPRGVGRESHAYDVPSVGMRRTGLDLQLGLARDRRAGGRRVGGERDLARRAAADGHVPEVERARLECVVLVARRREPRHRLGALRIVGRDPNLV